MQTKKLSMLALIIVAMISCAKERFINEAGNLVPKTVQEDPSLPVIAVNGSFIHSEAYGHPDSNLVVFLHGGPGGDYRSLLNGKELANHGYRVVFYDQRGSGLSQRFSKASYTSLGLGALDVMYNELSAVIAHYRTSATQKVFLVGHSWGGILATGYVAKYPNAVQGLVVAEPGGLKWTDIKDYMKRSTDFNLWGELFNDVSYLDQFISGKNDQHNILDYKLAMLSARNEVIGEYNTEPGSFWRAGAVINTAMFEIGDKYHHDFSTGISNFTKRVAFLYSEKNTAYPLTWAEKISSVYGAVNIYKVPGTGHSGIFQDRKVWRETTMSKIISYLESL